MKSKLLLLLFFISPLLLCGQFFIKGKVTDSETQLPLKGASVYINNSTKGVITNEKGEFELGPLEAGRYEVVASYIGYQPLLYRADLNAASLRISFKMDKKETLLREVLVLTDEMRRKYLEIFKKNVLGMTVAAEKSKIKNISEVQFSSGENKNEILAYSETELEIENPELGYTIYFELIDFYYNKSNGSTYFFGYTRFVDWGKNEKTKKKWIRERREAYDGSTVHFFRSLLNKNLIKDGFTVYQLGPKSNPKIDTVRGGGISINMSNSQGLQTAQRTIEDSMLKIYPDSVYKIYELKLKDGWRVIYNKSTKLKNEVMRKAFTSGQVTGSTVSGLRYREKPVLISNRGILLTPMNLFFDGIWGYERLANMLPEDYESE